MQLKVLIVWVPIHFGAFGSPYWSIMLGETFLEETPSEQSSVLCVGHDM